MYSSIPSLMNSTQGRAPNNLEATILQLPATGWKLNTKRMPYCYTLTACDSIGSY
uniref:Uncharacterized protein n=1 Tax=Arundo donax TaxID=35708 RepID=A0A0A9FI24_ARUDO